MDNLEIHYKLDMFAVFDIVPHYKGKKFIFGVSYSGLSVLDGLWCKYSFYTRTKPRAEV